MTTMHAARRSDPQSSHDAARIERATLTDKVRSILRDHPEGLTADRVFGLTGEPGSRHGSVASILSRIAVPSGEYGKSELDCRATKWVLP